MAQARMRGRRSRRPHARRGRPRPPARRPPRVHRVPLVPAARRRARRRSRARAACGRAPGRGRAPPATRRAAKRSTAPATFPPPRSSAATCSSTPGSATANRRSARVRARCSATGAPTATAAATTGAVPGATTSATTHGAARVSQPTLPRPTRECATDRRTRAPAPTAPGGASGSRHASRPRMRRTWPVASACRAATTRATQAMRPPTVTRSVVMRTSSHPVPAHRPRARATRRRGDRYQRLRLAHEERPHTGSGPVTHLLDRLDPSRAAGVTGDEHDRVDAGGDLRAHRGEWKSARRSSTSVSSRAARRAATIRVDGGHRPVVTGVERLEHVECLRAPDLAHDQTIGPHAQRRPHQIAHADPARTLGIRWACLEPHDVRLPQAAARRSPRW